MVFPGVSAHTAVISQERRASATICPALGPSFIYAIEHGVNTTRSSPLINYPSADSHLIFFNLKVFITFASVNNARAAVKNLAGPTVPLHQTKGPMRL